MRTAADYYPELEQDYNVNRWVWYRAGSPTTDEPHSLPADLFRLLIGGRAGSFYRSYPTEADAMDDLRQALAQAAD